MASWMVMRGRWVCALACVLASVWTLSACSTEDQPATEKDAVEGDSVEGDSVEGHDSNSQQNTQPDTDTSNDTSSTHQQTDTQAPLDDTNPGTDQSADQDAAKGAPARPDPREVELGDFLMVSGGALAADLGEEGVFRAHILSARQGAEVTVEVTGAVEADLTLHVFGPAEGALIGDALLVVSDDAAGRGLNPSASFVAPADGKYGVVVGHFDGQAHAGAGAYSVEAQCEGEACEAVSFVASACPVGFVRRGVACVQDLLADAESGVTELHEAATLCADAEPMARPYDAQCIGADRAIFCGVDYAQFWQEIYPACTDAIFFDSIAQECRFGARFQDVRDQIHVAITQRQTLTSADSLSPEVQAQVVAAVNQSSHEVSSAAEGFGVVDGGEIEQFELVDLARRRYTAYEYGAGDNSYGAIFVGDTTDIAAAIIDGDLTNCLAPDAAGQPCAQSADCGDFACVGVFEGLGRCAAQAPVDGEGTTCDAANTCAPGLFCAANSVSPSGLCVAPWMVGHFNHTPFQTVLDNDPQGLSAQTVVTGLATVSQTVFVQAVIRHPDPDQLQVYLQNPATTEVLVAQGEEGVNALALGVDVAGFPGDESANGAWTLRVVDGAAGGVGWLESWRLTIASRLD